MTRCIHLILLLILFVSTSCEQKEQDASAEKTAGVSEHTIRIGSSSALTGHAGFLGTQYLHGAMTYINEVNQKGGIHGRQIEVIALDDQYNPIKTIANTQKLIHEEQVFALFNYVGTPTSVAVRPIIEEAQIPAFGFFTGAEKLREPVTPYIFHLRDSYYAEAEGAISHFVDKLGLKKIGVFYQDDAFGIAVLTGIQLALQKRGLEPFVTDTYTRGSMDIQTGVDRINSQDVDVVMMVGTYCPLAKFIKLTHDQNKFPYFSTVSFVGSEAFAKEIIHKQNIAKEQYSNVIVTQVVPSPHADKLPAVKEYLALNKKYFPNEEPNYVAFEGFLNAKILVLGLEKSGTNLTRPELISTLHGIKDFDLNIKKMITYGTNDQQGINGVYLSHLRQSGNFEIFDTKEH